MAPPPIYSQQIIYLLIKNSRFDEEWSKISLEDIITDFQLIL
jgi:hypothetical protein